MTRPFGSGDCALADATLLPASPHLAFFDSWLDVMSLIFDFLSIIEKLRVRRLLGRGCRHTRQDAARQDGQMRACGTPGEAPRWTRATGTIAIQLHNKTGSIFRTVKPRKRAVQLYAGRPWAVPGRLPGEASAVLSKWVELFQVECEDKSQFVEAKGRFSWGRGFWQLLRR